MRKKNFETLSWVSIVNYKHLFGRSTNSCLLVLCQPTEDIFFFRLDIEAYGFDPDENTFSIPMDEVQLDIQNCLDEMSNSIFYSLKF